ncbi:response regulator [Paenibacillus piri]|uniref:Response regulator n=1 Tax=Paenibacillus piri TaxID=2547395 RepID=A0A4R5KTB3_9BACL|nr:response regulator [Paenibacillus piri]TDF98662.1 response regulator [Paenibacillus piri]
MAAQRQRLGNASDNCAPRDPGKGCDPMNTALTILIVDDEKPIRQWFEYVIRQYEEEFEIAGVCSNGKEALDMYEQYKPDIIITDIRMPVMDGLELIQAVKERGGSPQFLILSNYDHFEYVKKGLVMGAKDYLLKAETADVEIIEALRIIRKEGWGNTRAAIAGDSHEFAGTLIRDYLRHHSIGQEPLQKIESYLADASLCPGYILTFSMDGYFAWARAANSSEEETRARLDLLSAIIQEHLKKWISSVAAVQTAENECVIIVGKRTDDGRPFVEVLPRLCEEMNNYLRLRFGCTVSFGFGSAFETLKEMKLAYTGANEAKEYRFYSGPSGLHVYGRHKKDDVTRDRCLMYVHELLKHFQFADEHVVERVDQTLDGIFNEGQNGLTPQDAKKMIVNMMEMLNHKLMGMMEGGTTSPFLYDPDFLLQDSEFKSHFRNRVIEQLTAMLETSTRHLFRYSEATNKIIRYLFEHYPQKVEMFQLASLVHLNENYISQMFKKETGQSVTRFLMSVRMERAKELLLENKLKINEIASEVGYTSESHFCTAFKMYYGKSPRNFMGDLRKVK